MWLWSGSQAFQHNNTKTKCETLKRENGGPMATASFTSPNIHPCSVCVSSIRFFIHPKQRLNDWLMSSHASSGSVYGSISLQIIARLRVRQWKYHLPQQIIKRVKTWWLGLEEHWTISTQSLPAGLSLSHAMRILDKCFASIHTNDALNEGKWHQHLTNMLRLISHNITAFWLVS